MQVLVDKIPSENNITYHQFLSRVNRFKVSDVLKRCNHARAWLEKQASMDKALLALAPNADYLCPARVEVYLAPSRIAFLAKTSLLRSTENRQRQVTDLDFAYLIYMQANMTEAFTAKPNKTIEDNYSFLIRMEGEQSLYQERLRGAFARSWMIYIDANRSMADRRQFDLEEEWRRFAGIELGRFILLGFNYYAGVNEHESVTRYFASSGIFTGMLFEEDCERFLALASTTPEGFREESSKYEVSDPLYKKSEFNVLWSRPLISIGQELICPLPVLVANRVADGIRFDLREAMRVEGLGNRFSQNFGLLFEEYIGRLLKWSYGEEKVHHEPIYGKPEKGGPDWVVIDGDTAVLIECRTRTLRVETRALAEFEDVRDDVRKMFVDTLIKYPSKIQDLMSGRTGLDFSGVVSVVPLIVTYERVSFEAVYREIARMEFEAAGKEWFGDYELMGSEDFELLSAWHTFRPVHEIVQERKKRYKEQPNDMSDFLRLYGRENELQFNHPLMAEILDRLLETGFDALEGGMPVDPEKLASLRHKRE